MSESPRKYATQEDLFELWWLLRDNLLEGLKHSPKASFLEVARGFLRDNNVASRGMGPREMQDAMEALSLPFDPNSDKEH